MKLTIPLAWLWKTSQGETNEHFSNRSPESTPKSISCCLILQSYSLHTSSWNPDMDDQHSKIIMTWKEWQWHDLSDFWTHLRCPWRMNTHHCSQLHMCLAVTDFQDSSAYLLYQKPSPSWQTFVLLLILSHQQLLRYVCVSKLHAFHHFSKSCHHKAIRVPLDSLSFPSGWQLQALKYWARK